MLSLAFPAVALLSALLPTALAQTHTKCNPLNATGCADMPALGGQADFNFNDTLYPKIWTKANQGKVDWSEAGATLTVAKSGDSPQLISNFYLFFGRIEVVMKAAHGQGIISSAILQSEDLDEIDWEFMGSESRAYTNYYGQGYEDVNDTSLLVRGADFNMTSPQTEFHNYTLDWTKDRLQWWLDGTMLRELKSGDAVPSPKYYPQTPMNIRVGVWSAGDTANNAKGVVEWAGETDFGEGPFSMTVQQIYAQDYTSAKTYSWADMDSSGSWEKVKVIALEEGEKSDAVEEYEAPSGLSNRFNALSKTAKIAIIACSCGAAAIGLAIFLFCCIKQRRAGRREGAAYQSEENKEAAAELIDYRGAQTNGGKPGYSRI